MKTIPSVRETFLVATLVLVLAVAAVATAAPAGAQSQPPTVSIQEIQEPTGENDSSPYAGSIVTTSGTVTAVTGEGYYVQNGTGAYSGVYVYTGGEPGVASGDVVEVTAPVEEYYNLTELDVTAANASVTTVGSEDVPEPVALESGDIGQEAYEGVLVTVSDVTVTATPGQYGEWAVDDGSGAIAIDDVTAGDRTTPNETGATIDSITGPLHYSFEEYKIQPTSVGTIEAPSAGDGSGDDSGNETVEGTTLTVLSYNDIQTAASDPEAMGRLAGAVEQRRAAHDNPTVLVGGGDQVSPSSLSPVSNWTVPIQTTNEIAPAADVIGNHDLDYGFAAVANFSAASEYPWLLANVRHEDGGNVPGTQNYTVVERDGVRIGVVGLVDEAIEPKTAVDFDEHGYEVTDYSTVGERVASQLKDEQNVDVVIAATHIGVPDSKELARETENIDVIVTGDDEIEYAPQTTDGTVIMEAEARADHLAELNLTVGENGDVQMASGRLHEVAGNDAFEVDETVRDIVADARGKYLDEVIGQTEVELDSTFAANYHDETAWGNLITDAFRNRTGAEVAITNAGGIRGDFVIEPGNVTYDDVYTSLPFGNTLVTKELDGAELTALLESQVVTLDSPEGQQYGAEPSLQVSGVTYEMVPHEDADPIVRDVHVNGEPVQANETYNVTLNSYMAGWDDIADEPTVDRDYTLYGTAVAEYIEAKGTVAPEDTNRIRRVDREVGAEWLFVRGGHRVPVHYDVPDTVRSVNTSSVRIENATSGVLHADSARLEDDDLVAYFDAREFYWLASQSNDLQVYANYNDSEYSPQLVYFDSAVLNGDLENWQLPDEGEHPSPPWADDDHPGSPPWSDGDHPGNPPWSDGDHPGNPPWADDDPRTGPPGHDDDRGTGPAWGDNSDRTNPWSGDDKPWKPEADDPDDGDDRRGQNDRPGTPGAGWIAAD